MIKFILGLLIGLSIVSTLADEKSKVSISNGMPFIKINELGKVMAHLDDEELTAIKEACK